MMTEKKDDLKDKIIKDLHTTGFVKELEIARFLNSNGWKPKLNETFVDKDTNISREIDIVATKKGQLRYDSLHLWVELVIECKKTTNPWIILSNSDESFLNFHLFPGWTIIHGGEKYLNNGGIFPPRLIDQHFMRSNSDRIGSAFHEAFKEPRETSKIFQSIMKACKAAVHKAEIYGASPNWSDYKKEDPTHLTFYHPIVVVDGPLFEVYLDDSNEIKLIETNWIPTTYRYSSKNYSEHDSKDFHCDIVLFSFFEKYLEKVDKWLTTMNQNFVDYYKENYA